MPDALVNPGVQYTSPQGKYRSNLALPKSEFRPKLAHRKLFAAAVSGHSSVTPQQYDAEVIKYQGVAYSQRGDRCGSFCTVCPSYDCSGLQCHVLRVLGLSIGCCTSFVMASMCWDEGLFLPLDAARTTQSHWAVIGNDFGRRPLWNGDGHIVDGRGIVNGRAETMEAMGTRWGCLIANWDGRGWNAAYRIPGINYYTPPVWKVQPVYNPALEVRDILNDPGKGAWVGMSDGTVIYSGPNNEKIQGGMTLDPGDRAAWGNRTLAQLAPYTRHDGSSGYEIIATTNERYVPKNDA